MMQRTEGHEKSLVPLKRKAEKDSPFRVHNFIPPCWWALSSFKQTVLKALP